MPPADARARAIISRLREESATADEVLAAFEELDQLPPDVVRSALEPWTGPAPDLERLDDTMRRAHRLPLRTPRLSTLESARDADVLDLGPVAEEQLRVAGRTWDGQDLDPFERLDGEREDSFAGTLERRVLGEGKQPLYDVMLFGDGSGVFFRAGTTKVLGVIADHRIETTDRPARLALEAALGGSPAAVEHVDQEQLALPMIDPLPPTEPAPRVEAQPRPLPVRKPIVAPEAEPEEREAPEAKPKKKAAAKKKKVAAEKPKKKAAAKKKTAASEKSSEKPAKAKKKTAAKKKKKAAVSDDDE